MCSFEKSQKPDRIPTFDWIAMVARSLAENVTAPPKRLSHSWGCPPYMSA